MDEHWQIILTAGLIPISVGLLFIMIKRMFSKHDAVETSKDTVISRLRAECRALEDSIEEQDAKENKQAHDRLFKALSAVNNDVKSIDATLKLINGSVRSAKAELDLHIVKGH